MLKHSYNDYYANREYVYDSKDPMVKTTMTMLRNYYKGTGVNVHVVKWYRNNGTVVISVRRA